SQDTRGRRGDEVSAAGGNGTHGGNDGNPVVPGLDDFAPDRVRSHVGTAGTIDTQQNGGNRLVRSGGCNGITDAVGGSSGGREWPSFATSQHDLPGDMDQRNGRCLFVGTFLPVSITG